MHYSGYDQVVSSGNYDNTTGTLTVIDGRNPVGHVNVVNKRITGTLAYNNRPFYLDYQGCDSC